MYDNQLFIESQPAFENCAGIKQAFTFLPPGTNVSIILDDRYPCTLQVDGQNILRLLPQKSLNADFEYCVYPEAIRRLKQSPPSDFIALYREIAALLLVGHLRLRWQLKPQDIIAKGYFQSLKNIPTEVQTEVTKQVMQFVVTASGSASAAFEYLKKFTSK
jgi:hypothetical protein